MKYQVIIFRRAELDIQNAYQHAFDLAPMTAARWYERLEQAIQSLENLPERCPISPEGEEYGLPVRQLIFGKRRGAFRILFTIEKMQVNIIHCVRATRQPLSRADVQL